MSAPRSLIKPDTLYILEDAEQWAITPDGVGMYWYDTEEEAAGNLPERYQTVSITSKALDVLRGDADPSSVPCAEPGMAHDPFDEDGTADPDGACTNCGLLNSFHHGHPMLSGGWWCDTCNSPLCDLA